MVMSALGAACRGNLVRPVVLIALHRPCQVTVIATTTPSISLVRDNASVGLADLQQLASDVMTSA